MRLLGIDPGLQKTGWGVIDYKNNSLSYVASGTIKTNAKDADPYRLAYIDAQLSQILGTWSIEQAAVEETFVNNNPKSALKLGQARGIALLAPARAQIPVMEYSPTLIKKTIVGTGHASKDQINLMIKTLLPKAGDLKPDEADALAIAITHAHHGTIHNLTQKAS
ncbi:MAG: crossover junction endodeoxyribonuclease RuvC [Bdellovibrionales bacterium]